MNNNSGWKTLIRRPAYLAIALLFCLALGATQVRGAMIGDDGSSTDPTADQSMTTDPSTPDSTDATDTADNTDEVYAQATPSREPANGGGFNGGRATAQAQAQPLIVSAGGPYSGIVGRSITFTGVVANPPPGASLSYLWSFPDGSVRSGQSVAFAFQSAGNFSVSLQVSASNGASGQASASAQISGPTLSISANGPYSGNVGQQIAMTASVIGGNAPFQFSWSFGDGTSANGQTVSHAYASGGTFTITVSASSGSTGQSVPPATTFATISQQSPISVNVGGPYSGVAGQGIAFNAFINNPTVGFATYNWNFGDGSGGSGQSPVHAYNSPGSYTVTVTASLGGQSGQASTVATIAGSFTVSANGPYSGAAGQAIAFTASASNSLSSVFYRWSFGDGTSSGSPSPFTSTSHTYASPGIYTLTVTGTAGLTGQSSAISTTQVTVTGGLQVTAGGPYVGTAGQALTLIAGAGNQPFDTVYSWQFGDGTSGSGQSVSHVYNSPGAYTATVTASSRSSNQSQTATANVRINAPQSLNVAISAPAQGTTNSPITFSATASGNFPGSPVLTWNFGDNTSSVQGAQVQHSFNAPGSYTVTVTATSSSNPALSTQGTTTIAINTGGPSVTYQPGWNLVAGPAGTVFFDAAGVLYTFQAGNASYVSLPATQGVDAGKGYWAFFATTTTIGLNGQGTTAASITAPAGQYVMIGNPSATTPVTVNGADSIFIFNTGTNSYEAATILAPGQGAWALSNRGGTITLSPSAR